MNEHTRTVEVRDKPAEEDAERRDGGRGHRPAYALQVDGAEYRFDRPTITGAEIMVLAGIPPADGLVEILPDGERKTIHPDDIVKLAPRSQFRSRPRFKRG